MEFESAESIPVMRLTELQIDTIRATAARILGSDADVWLRDSIEVLG